MRLDIYRNGKVAYSTDKCLSEVSFSNELSFVPNVVLDFPIDEMEYFRGHAYVKLYIGRRVFPGIITDCDPDFSAGTIKVEIKHVLHEWSFRQISVNEAVKDRTLNVVYKTNAQYYKTDKKTGESIVANDFMTTKYPKSALMIELAKASAWVTASGEKVTLTTSITPKKDNTGAVIDKTYVVTFKTSKNTYLKVTMTLGDEQTPPTDNYDYNIVDQLEDIFSNVNFAYGGWTIDYENGVQDRMIDYVYSKQTKLSALNKTIEATPDLYYRVGFTDERRLEIGTFGEKKNCIISNDVGGENVTMLDEPTIDYRFDNVINIATVYSSKSDTGYSTLTLREVYERPELWQDGFPVIILRGDVNNERDYSQYSTKLPIIAPNGQLEYAVMDEESVALESGMLLEGTFAFNDIAPFNTSYVSVGETLTITNTDRINAAKTAYSMAVKRLKQSRRKIEFTVSVANLPLDVSVGDKVRFTFDRQAYMVEPCGNYYKKITSDDDYYYVNRIDYRFDEHENEINTLVLSKYLDLNNEVGYGN